MDRKKIGTDAEQRALTHLKAQGLRLVTQNYHCRFGEIDLIMQEQQTLVFVEVRLRHNPHFGSAADSVTPTKQRKIIITAEHFLNTHPRLQLHTCRFDVIAFDGTGALSSLLWYKDAFRV